MLLVDAHLARREVVFAMAQPLRQVALADVVQHRADAQVLHLLGREAEAAAHQQGDDADVHGVHRRLVAGALGEDADAELARVDHLVDQGAGQLLGLRLGLARLAGDHLDRLPAQARGLAVLPLADLLRLALRLQSAAMRADRPIVGRRLGCAELVGRGVAVGLFVVGGLAGVGRGVGVGVVGGGTAGARQCRRRLAAVEQRQVAVLRAPAHPGEAERADRRHLRRRRDAKAAERKRVRHPAHVEMHEHADAQRLDVDLGGKGGWLHLFGPRSVAAHGASGVIGPARAGLRPQPPGGSPTRANL